MPPGPRPTPTVPSRSCALHSNSSGTASACTPGDSAPIHLHLQHGRTAKSSDQDGPDQPAAAQPHAQEEEQASATAGGRTGRKEGRKEGARGEETPRPHAYLSLRLLCGKSREIGQSSQSRGRVGGCGDRPLGVAPAGPSAGKRMRQPPSGRRETPAAKGSASLFAWHRSGGGRQRRRFCTERAVPEQVGRAVLRKA